MQRQLPLLLAAALLGGCSRAPSINVLGAFIPDWLFCASGALVLTALMRRSLRAAGLGRGADAGTVALAFAALWTLFALAAWLLFFRN